MQLKTCSRLESHSFLRIPFWDLRHRDTNLHGLAKKGKKFCLACFIIAGFATSGVKLGICRAVGFNTISVPSTRVR